MDLNPEVAELAVRLGEIGARTSVATIRTRIAATKAARQDRETIEVLEEIVDELISDRSEVLGIAQAFEDELVAQRISDEDIGFITSELAPKFEELFSLSGRTAPDNLEEIRGLLDVIVSKETVTILQLLGFNFREAIGRPLTELMARLINTRGPGTQQVQDTEKLQRLILENQITMGRLARDPEAYERFMMLTGRTPPQGPSGLEQSAL